MCEFSIVNMIVSLLRIYCYNLRGVVITHVILAPGTRGRHIDILGLKNTLSLQAKCEVGSLPPAFLVAKNYPFFF